MSSVAMSKEDPNSIVMRHAVEDAEQRELMKRAAPLAAELTYGINYFEPKQYRDLVYFLLEGKRAEEALDRGDFTVERFVRIVRVRDGQLMTVSELSRITKVPQKSLWRWVTKANLPHRSVGNKKLYNLKDIENILVTHREGR